jgi:glutamate-1-semialdehyde 2,1-aminomutase
LSIVSDYVAKHGVSRRLAERAGSVFPDGVTHDIRRNDPFSLYVAKAQGSHKTDVDGNDIIDYVMGHGALLVGHNHPQIVAAVGSQLTRGTHYGASHEQEVRWGELIQNLVPSAERVRFTSSGTEATMMAVRLARAYTGRPYILRLCEHFHGWNDSVVGQPSAEETLPASPGITPGALSGSIVIPQNDVQSLERSIQKYGADIAALIIEPTGAHWGTEPIDVAFVRTAREVTQRAGILLIFDEVITGFRVSPGGAQSLFGIQPDLTTMAKIVAGGLPGGCVAGRAELLEQISFGNRGARIAHPGTFNANPLSASAGAACLAIIADGAHQTQAAATAADLARALNVVLRGMAVSGCVYGMSSMLHVALGPNEPPPDGYSWGDSAPPRPIVATASDGAALLRLALLNEGVDLMGDGMMVSSAHNAGDVAATIDAFGRALSAIRAEGVEL